MVTGTEIIILQLVTKDDKEAQDLVIEVEFEYNFGQPAVMDEPAEPMEITLEHMWGTYKTEVTDERPEQFEIPLGFFTPAMLEYVENCIVENFVPVDDSGDYTEDYRERDNS